MKPPLQRKRGDTLPRKALNGNVLSDADEVNGSWSYKYDDLDRLYAAVPGAGAASGYANHSLCMYYDDFGNRTQAAWQSAACPAPPVPGAAAPSPTATYNSANQVTNNFYAYDKSGNVSYDGASWYAYDNEGRLCAVQTGISGSTVATGYLYDAEGRRVAKGSITVSSTTPLSSSMCNPATNGFTPTETYVLGLAGEELTTYTWNGSQSTWARTNVYGAGLLATYDAVGISLHFHLTDQVGTRRVQTDPSGTPETDCQSLPYGDGLNCFAPAGAPSTGASGDDATPLHFTGKQRDIESGMITSGPGAVPGFFCTSGVDTNWDQRSGIWHEGRSIVQSRW